MNTRVTSPGRHAGRCCGSRGVWFAGAALLTLLVFCGLAALIPAPAAAAATTSALEFTPLNAATGPSVTITAPGGGGDYAEGSLLAVTWTTSAAAPTGGQFRVRVGDTNGNYGSATYVSANGGTAYGVWVTIDVPHDSVFELSRSCVVAVDWRPETGSGSWLSSAVSTASFTVGFFDIGHAYWPSAITHPQGSRVAVGWMKSFCWTRDVRGEFGIWLRSSDGTLYSGRTVTASDAQRADDHGAYYYETTLALDAPPGSGYRAVVAWRPTPGVGFWGEITTGKDTLTVTARPSTDLSDLVLSGSPSHYTFDPSTYTYEGVTVPYAASSFTVTPTGEGVLKVNGATVSSGSASAEIPLTAGKTKTITVVAKEAERTSKTYTIAVKRNKAAPATPSFSPSAGAVTNRTKVSIRSEGAGRIFYTTDGSTPTRRSSLYTGPIVLKPAMTLKALAVKRGHDNSAVGTASYTLAATKDLRGLALTGQPANFSFARSTYAYPDVTVRNAVWRVKVTPTGSGVITVNGAIVRSGRASSSIPLVAGSTRRIKVRSRETGKSAKTYTLLVTRNLAAQAAPTFSPAAGMVEDGTLVTITSADADHIYYTTDGTTPSRSSSVYTQPVAVSPPMTLKALAVKEGHDDSAVASASYAVVAATQYVVTASDYAPTAGTSVTVSAQLADANGNAVRTAGKVVTWTKSNAAGSFAGATSTTNANGVATVSLTPGTVAGTETRVTATDAASLTGVSSAVTTVAGAVDHFDLVLATPQTCGVAFTGTNTLTAKDAYENTADFDAAEDNVRLTATGGVISGIHSGAVLNEATDFSGGVADLTALGMTFTGDAGDYYFMAASTTGSYTGLSNVVTIAVPGIGEPYGGGVVAYILQDGDPGYVAGETHGLIVTQTDQSTGIAWALSAYQSIAVPDSGAQGTLIGTGRDNTNAIVSQNGATLSTYAAGLCYNLDTGGYSDWYLPSKDELSKLYLNRSAIGMTANAWYWSSSEYAFSATDEAWGQVFPNGSQMAQLKSNDGIRVRAIRSF